VPQNEVMSIQASSECRRHHQLIILFTENPFTLNLVKKCIW